MGFALGMAVVFGVLAAPGLNEPLAGLRIADAGQGGHSVHLKNRATPEWMRDLQARQAQQAPVALDNRGPSFWI